MGLHSAPALTPTLIRQLAAELGIRPTKKLGQNFVHDAGTVRRIAQIAGVTAGDSVLEIGPGLGSLTLALLEQGAQVTALEIDRTLAEALPQTIGRLAPDFAERLHVVCMDGLELAGWPPLETLQGIAFDLDPAAVPASVSNSAGQLRPEAPVVVAEQLPPAHAENSRLDAAVEPTGRSFLPAPRLLVANLPYNVSVPLLLNALEALPSLESATVMVQAEVADRMSAQPGSKIYGAPTVKLAWYGAAKLAGTVSRSVFWPVPNVDSALVKWDRGQTRGMATLRRATFKLVDVAFGQRRKKIRTPLKEWLQAVNLGEFVGAAVGAAVGEVVDELLEAAHINPDSRAEALTIDDYVRLGEAVLELSRSQPGLAQKVTELEREGATRSRNAPVPKSVTASAPGKVNLVLQSAAKGADGYHQLATIFEALSLRETVRCTAATATATVTSTSRENSSEAPGRDASGARRADPTANSRQSTEDLETDEVVAALTTTTAYLPDGQIDRAATEIMRKVPPRQHLAARAAQLLADYAREQHLGQIVPVTIEVHKRVPIAGGMAGGSADAAAVLVALNELWQLRLSAEELEQQGRKLGADVPACLTGGICLGQERGDHMTPLAAGHGDPNAGDGTPGTGNDEPQQTADSLDSPDSPNSPGARRSSVHWWVLAIPTEGLSTPAVFQEFDRLGAGRDELSLSPATLQAVGDSPGEVAKILDNDLQVAALSLRPELAELGQIALQAGALQWTISGSGPTVAALAVDRESAERIQRALETLAAENSSTGAADSLARIPEENAEANSPEEAHETPPPPANPGGKLKTTVIAWGPALGAKIEEIEWGMGN